MKNQNPYLIDIFTTSRSIFIFLFLALLTFCINLYDKYSTFSAINTKTPIALDLEVIAQYQKLDAFSHPYNVLKTLDGSSNVIYLSSKDDLKPLVGHHIIAYGKLAKNCNFYKFLSSCYFQAYTISLLPDSSTTSIANLRSDISSFIFAQHSDLDIGALYSALFLATPLDKSIRTNTNLLGIGHLIAISGYHLGLLSSVLYILLFLLYAPIHRRFYPYRNRYYDIAFTTLIFMLFYLFLLDFTPSFLRAFLMAAFGFYLMFCSLSLLNFKTLFIVSVFCIALFPSLVLNVGFQLSVFGVFNIFLFFRYFNTSINFHFSSTTSPRQFLRCLFIVLAFNSFIFINMQIFSHFYFPLFSPYSFLSIILSVLFLLFFPLALLLHIFGFGALFDPFISHYFLRLDLPSISIYTPTLLLIFYLSLALLSIFSRRTFYAYFALNILFSLYMLLAFYSLL